MLKNWDRKILHWALDRSSLILISSGALFVIAMSLIPMMGRDFLPQFNEGTAMVTIIAKPGISLNESNRIGQLAEKIILETKEIKSASRRTGRAEMDEHAEGVNVSEIDVDFHPNGRERDIVLDEIRARLKKEIPTVGISLGQPISHLIDHMLSGVSAAVAIKIFGPDLNTLRQKAAELRKAIESTQGLVDLKIEQQGLIPQIKIKVMREDATRFGLSPGEVTQLLEAALNGETVAQIIEDARIYDVFFQFDETSRGSIEKMQDTVLKIMPDGRKVKLKDVADVFETTGPNSINRENGQRRIVISANVSGRDLSSLVEEIQNRVKSQIKLPDGYYVIYGGQFESQQSATRKILLFGILSILGIALVLYSHFQSAPLVAQVMSTIPLAFIGGLIFLFATERTFTVASLVGFITLCGVASRNSIMMISHYLHLLKFEDESFSKEMVIRGSQERLVPVVMTACVASLALLPLVFAKGQSGSEILHPVAIVIVGGLVSSTLLDIIVTPTLFYRFGKKSSEKYLNNKKENL